MAIKTPVGNAPVVPVAMIITGFYLAWFGIHYWRRDVKWPSDPVKSVLQGKGITSPGTAPAPYESTLQTSEKNIAANAGISAGGLSGGQVIPGGGGSAISMDALRYQGKGYVWGGPADVPGNWDCSSFVSYVLGHDLGLKLPGGGHYGDSGYPPHAHGPTTLDYQQFGLGIDYGKEQPGDLLVTADHIGICIGGGQMISAEDPQSGTGIAGYQSGFPGGTPSVRRVAVSTGTTQAPGTTTAGGRG